MNYSDEFDVTSSSDASVEDSMDKEQLKLYLSRGEKRLEATNKLLGEARNAILQLQSQHLDSRPSPIRSTRTLNDSLANSLADSTVSTDSISAIQNQLQFITSQMQNMPAKQQNQIIALKEKNAKMEQELQELRKLLAEREEDQSNQQFSSKIHSMDREIQDLKLENNQMKDEVKEYERKIDELTRENVNLLYRIDENQLNEERAARERSTLHKKEIDKLVLQKSDLENKISNLENTINKLMRDHETEVSELTTDFEKKLAQQKAEINKTIKLMEEEKQELIQQQKDLSEKFTQDKLNLSETLSLDKKQLIEQLNEEKRSQIEKLVNEKHELIDQFNHEKLKLMQEAIHEKNEMMERSKKERDALIEKNKQEVELIQEKLRSEKDKFDTERALLMEKHSKEKDALVEKFTTVLKEKEEMVKEKERLVYKYNNEINSTIEKCKMEVEALQSSSEREKKQLIQQHDNERSMLIAQHEKEKATIRSRLEAEVNELLDKHANEKEQLQIEFQEQNLSTVQRYEQEKKRLIESYEIQIKSLKERMDHEKSVVLDTCEKEKSNADSQRVFYENEIQKMLENHSSAMNELKHAHEKLLTESKETLDQERSTHKLEKLRLENEIERLREQFNLTQNNLIEKYEDEKKHSLQRSEEEKNQLKSQHESEKKTLTEHLTLERKQKDLLQTQYEKLMEENQQLTKKLVVESKQGKLSDKLEVNFKKELTKLHKDHLVAVENLKGALRFCGGSDSDVKFLKEVFFKELERLKSVLAQIEESNYVHTAEEMKSMKDYCLHLENEIAALYEQNRILNGKMRNITKSISLEDASISKQPPLKKEVAFNDSISTTSDEVGLDQSMIHQQSFDDQMELLNQQTSDIIQESDQKIHNFLHNITIMSEKHATIIDTLKKKHIQMKKIIQMEYWTALRKLRLKPASSVSKIPRAKRAFTNSIDRIDVFFMSHISTVAMAKDPRDVSFKEVERLYENEVARARSISDSSSSSSESSIGTNGNTRALTQYDVLLETTKEYLQDQDKQLQALGDVIKKINLSSMQQYERNVLKQCLYQIENLQKEDKITIREKMFKVLSESNSSMDTAKLVELILLREDQVSKFLDLEFTLLSVGISNLISSKEESITSKLGKRLNELCHILNQDTTDLPTSIDDMLRKLKDLVEVTKSTLVDNRRRAKLQLNDQVPLSVQRWLGDSDSEYGDNEGNTTPKKNSQYRSGVEVASPIKASNNDMDDHSWTPPKTRGNNGRNNVLLDDPNFYFVSNNEERISLDIGDREEQFISSPLKRKLDHRYKSILTAIRDDILRVKCISEIIPKLKNVMEHNAQMYSFIFSLINLGNYNGDKKFGYFLLDVDKVIDLDNLFADIIWYRRLYEKVKKELANAEDRDQNTSLYYKLKGAIVELKKQTTIIGNSHESNEDKEVILKLKRILNVQYTHEIVNECESMVSQLKQYVKTFPKFQTLINELCIGLNVKRIEDVIPAVKRLVKVSKSVNLLL
ncbi:hypothetical protein C9374_009452 [Naegleria lovaniensis]|uniref:Uncharacterized protein n=1 Tax=Naegleria lovaniensis TaxID=51637 RepID=A0AA88KWW3_NAELO|nr:uncharacterized protein C9374_009452 [Naegleria lovaniensis]KAG2392875.1 hypothetical protein C9374_009452 [Naegleria lovaniensis]